MSLADAPLNYTTLPPAIVVEPLPIDPDHKPVSLLVRVICGVVMCLGLVAYGATMWHFWEPATTHPDANGYWAQASLYATTGSTTFFRQNNAQYVGMHWLILTDKDDKPLVPSHFISRYPPGYPMLIAFVYKVFGWEATTLINPALALLTLLGVYLIVARASHPAFGIVAAAALVTIPSFGEFALTEISHMPVACAIVWGTYLFMRWTTGGHWWTAALAGFVFGCVPVTRYSETVVGLGVLACYVVAIVQNREIRKVWWHGFVLVAGGLIPVVPMMIRNYKLLGSPFSTGYTLSHESTGFTMDNFKSHWAGYLLELQGAGMGMIFCLGLLGMVFMAFRKRSAGLGLLLLLGSTPILLVYMAYYWAPGVSNGGGGGGRGGGMGLGATMRFMVPLLPVYSIGAGVALWQMTRGANLAVKIAVPTALLTLQCLMFGQSAIDTMRQQHDQKEPLALATKALASVTHEGDVVIAQGSALQDLDFIKKWKLVDAGVLSERGGGMFGGGGPPGGGGAPGGGGFFGGGNNGGGNNGGGNNNNTRGNRGNRGRGGFGQGGGMDPNANPSPQQPAKRIEQGNLYTGSQSHRETQFLKDIASWAGDKGVYVIASDSELESLVPKPAEFEVVKRISQKADPEEEAGDQNGPGGGPPGMMTMNRGGGGGGRRGGPFGNAFASGEDIVIAKVFLKGDK